MRELAAQIKATFEISPRIVQIEPRALAREFESSIKAARIVDRRNES